MNLRPGSLIARTQRAIFNRIFIALLFTSSVLAWSSSQELEANAKPRFKRTVAALHSAPGEVQETFASIALSELVEIYLAEADLARREAQEADNNRKLLGWAAAVDRFSGELLLAQEDVESGYPIRFSTSAPGPVGLAVGGRLILLGHPRADQQRALEQRVLAAFCDAEQCVELTARAEPQPPIPLSRADVNPQWSFNANGSVCENETLGIRVLFNNTSQLARLRAHCMQLFHEVALLVGELRVQQRHGVSIDWAYLELELVPGQTEHLVKLNDKGDSAILSLPLLNSAPQLLGRLTPLLQAETSGEKAPTLIIDGQQLGWDSFSG